MVFEGGDAIYLDLGLRFKQRAGDIIMSRSCVLVHMTMRIISGQRCTYFSELLSTFFESKLEWRDYLREQNPLPPLLLLLPHFSHNLSIPLRRNNADSEICAGGNTWFTKADILETPVATFFCNEPGCTASYVSSSGLSWHRRKYHSKDAAMVEGTGDDVGDDGRLPEEDVNGDVM